MRAFSLKSALLACAALTSLATLPATVRAEDAPPAGQAAGSVVRYETDFFRQYQVSTAFDMVLHVPGFVFIGGDSARGFSGTAGNVLIDGQRPTTKADLGNTLSNINSSQVDHLELITGGAPGIDMHGHRQIVNVIRKTDAKPAFSLLGIYRNMDGRTNAGVLLATFNSNHAGRTTDITADVFDFFDNGANNGRRYSTDAAGTSLMKIYQHAGGAGMESQASHSRPLWGGKVTVNGTYNPSVYEQATAYVDHTGKGVEHFTEKDTPSELGGQYERKLGHGLDLNLNVLNRHERVHDIDVYSDAGGTADYRALNQTSEHILNGRLSWEKRDGLTFNIGSESVFNSLDRASTFITSSSPLNVPTDTVRVEENRTESFVSANWKATRKLSFEGELKIEASTIAVPAAHRSDSFTYYKPRFQAVYALTDTTKISWKTIRQVDQLSFNGFASSVQLQTSHVTLGNTALVPQKDWLNTIIVEHTFWDKGAVSLALEHYDYEDTSDFIAVNDGAQIYTANGNIGNSKWDFVHLKLDTPLDKLWVPHGTLSIDWLYRQTCVKDPITGRDRRVSGVEPHIYTVSFSQEFARAGTSWGFDIQSSGKDRNYLANELDDAYFAPWTQVWFQYVTPKKLTFKVMLKNPFGMHFSQDRMVYQGLRDLSPVVLTQSTTSKIPPIIEMRLKKDF
ncbi:TonB-dependent receptor plug domain-containing protein [Asticcacaulis solisilvae]|uniref:TonB-dependent receptor plug domain-containing protein n=1 Tax=Asticcacaulis solisilvae TaxID=1217274 RepID=UPI003FD8F1C7